MRPDMKYVVIESGRSKSHKLWLKRSDIRTQKQKGEDFEGYLNKEGMRKFYRDTKTSTDVLSPLYGYLDKQVGRPWNDVYSEMSQHLDRRSVQGFHVWSHVWQYVERYAKIRNGIPFAVVRYGGWREVDGLYVDPRDGILKSRHKLLTTNQILKKRREEDYARHQVIAIDKFTQLHWIHNGWYLVKIAKIPKPFFCTFCARYLGSDYALTCQHQIKVRDVLGNGKTSERVEKYKDGSSLSILQQPRRDAYGSNSFYAVSKRQISTKEAQQYIQQK